MIFADRTCWQLALNPLTLRREALRRSGVSIIDLTESNPTRCGLSPGAGWLAALAEPAGASYEPLPQGKIEAREAVARYYREKGAEVDPGRIFLTAGTSEAYSFLFRLLGNPGDRLLSPRPSYPLLEFLAGLNDVTLAPYSLRYAGSWRLDGESLKTAAGKGAKAILLVNPNNPTGSFIKKDELSLLNPTAQGHGAALIADEVFSDYAFQDDAGRVPTLAGNGETLTFCLGGISKSLGLPQMKLGWMVVSGPADLAGEACRRLEIICDTYLSVNTPVQNALPAWLARRAEVQTGIRSRLAQNLALIDRELARAPSAGRLHGEGGWYATLRLPRTRSEEAWALRFLEKARVYVHPGYFFDFEEEPFCVVSLLPSPETFREGIARLMEVLQV